MLVNVIPSICLASVFVLPLLGKKFIHPLMRFFFVCLFFTVNIVKWPPRRSSSDPQTFIYSPNFWKHSLSSLPLRWCWGHVVWVGQAEPRDLHRNGRLLSARRAMVMLEPFRAWVCFQYQLWRLEDLWATKMPCSWTEKLESTKIPDGHFQPLPPFLPYWQRHRD